MADTTWNPGTRQEKAQRARTAALNTGNVTQEQHDTWAQLNGNNTYDYNNLNQDAKQQLVNYYNNSTVPVNQPSIEEIFSAISAPQEKDTISFEDVLKDISLSDNNKENKESKTKEDNKTKSGITSLQDILNPFATAVIGGPIASALFNPEEAIANTGDKVESPDMSEALNKALDKRYPGYTSPITGEEPQALTEEEKQQWENLIPQSDEEYQAKMKEAMANVEDNRYGSSIIDTLISQYPINIPKEDDFSDNKWLPNGMPNTPANRAALEKAVQRDLERQYKDIANGDITNGKKSVADLQSDADSAAVYDKTIGEVGRKMLDRNKNLSNQDTAAKWEYGGDVIDSFINNMNAYDYAEDKSVKERREKASDIPDINSLTDENLEDLIIQKMVEDMYDKDNNYLIDTRAAPEAYNQMDRFNYYVTNTPEGYRWGTEMMPELAGVINRDSSDTNFGNDQAFTTWRMAVKDLTDAGLGGSWDDATDRLWTDIWNDTSDLTEEEKAEYKLLNRGKNGKLDKESREEANAWMYDPVNQFNLSEYIDNPAEYSTNPQYNNFGKQANAILDFTQLLNSGKLGKPIYPYSMTPEEWQKFDTLLGKKTDGKAPRVVDENGNPTIQMDDQDLALYNLITLMQNKAQFEAEDINKILQGSGINTQITFDENGNPVSNGYYDRPLPTLVPGGDKTWYEPYVYDYEKEQAVENPAMFYNAIDTILALDPRARIYNDSEAQKNDNKDNNNSNNNVFTEKNIGDWNNINLVGPNGLPLFANPINSYL